MAPDWRVWAHRATLPRLRASVRSRTYRRLWILSAVAYLVISLFIGQMILIFPQATGLDSVPAQVEWFGAGELTNPYLVPAVLVLAPHLVIALALWPTVVMTLLGVGIGLSVAATVAIFVAQRRRQAELAASGVAPAVTGWAFLGACCCSSCAAQVAATGLVGAAVGASPSSLLTQSWPLALLQLGVVALSLLYLEYRLEAPAPRLVAAARPGRLVAAVALRVLLLIASVTWLFSLVLELAEGPTLTPGLLYHWSVEHVALGAFAGLCALAPTLVARGLPSPRLAPRALRAVLLVGGITWGIGVPAFLVAAGLGGFVNELLGFLGAPASWGAVAPDLAPGPTLYFHWAVQHLLLAGWAVAAAVAPRRVLDVVSVGEAAPAAGDGAAPAPRVVPAVDAASVEPPTRAL